MHTDGEGIIELVRRVVSERKVCINCLGRFFGGLLTGMDNRDRGRVLLLALSFDLLIKYLRYNERTSLKLLTRLASLYEIHQLKNFLLQRGVSVRERRTKCEVCSGIFDKIDDIAKKIVSRIREYDFEKFLIGVSVPAEVELKEDELKAEYKLLFSESIREELSREIGKRISRILGKPFSLRPDLTIIVNPYTGEIKVHSKDLIVVGEATVRGGRVFAPVCRKCGGRGCETCNFLGRIRSDTFEYAVGTEILKVTGGRRWSLSIKKVGNNERVRFRFKIKEPVKRGKELSKLIGRECPAFLLEAIQAIG